MKVLHFSVADGPRGGGSAVAAARIHEGLLARGIESRFCVIYHTHVLRNSFRPSISVLGRAVRRARTSLDEWLLRPPYEGNDYVLSTGAVGLDMSRIERREQPDIVQLHWIGGYSFRLSSLQHIRAPVVWRLSDQWPFCGLQHLEPDRTAYATPPRNVTWFSGRSALPERVRLRKLRTYSRMKELVLVSPSRWLQAETRHSALLGNRPIELIPTSCDTDLFAPRDRNSCRAALGLSQQSRIILVGATSMRTKWKGMDLFLDAMSKFCSTDAAPPVEIITFGHDPFDPAMLNQSVRVNHFGPVNDRRLMATLYNAADVFAAPSRMENLANTVLESLACGTPAGAFDICGMPDMIEHGKNGFLAPAFDTGAFATGIRWGIEQRGREDIRNACRQKILSGFSREQEIEKYVALYERLLVARAPALERPVIRSAGEVSVS